VRVAIRRSVVTLATQQMERRPPVCELAGNCGWRYGGYGRRLRARFWASSPANTGDPAQPRSRSRLPSPARPMLIGSVRSGLIRAPTESAREVERERGEGPASCGTAGRGIAASTALGPRNGPAVLDNRIGGATGLWRPVPPTHRLNPAGSRGLRRGRRACPGSRSRRGRSPRSARA
jgi:hypothetical protein